MSLCLMPLTIMSGQVPFTFNRKFEEIYPPEVAEFVYITDDTYTAKQVILEKTCTRNRQCLHLCINREK